MAAVIDCEQDVAGAFVGRRAIGLFAAKSVIPNRSAGNGFAAPISRSRIDSRPLIALTIEGRHGCDQSSAFSGQRRAGPATGTLTQASLPQGRRGGTTGEQTTMSSSNESYIPAEDAEFRNFATTFANGITADPALYMLTSAQALSIQQAVDEFCDAYQVVVEPATKTKVTVIAKDNAKNIAENLCR